MAYDDLHRPLKRAKTINGKAITAVFLAIALVIAGLLSITPSLFKSYFSGALNRENRVRTSEAIAKVRNLVMAKPNTFGIYVYDLTSGDEYGINEKAVFTAASINKLPILADLYSRAAQKEIDLDASVVVQEGDLQEGSGVVRAGQGYSYKTLARLMMQKSDNTAAHLFGITLEMEKIQEKINSWGLRQTNVGENKTSAYDTGLLLRKIYQNEIAGPVMTPEMLGFMTGSDTEDRIPAKLPKEIKVYHKTGDGLNQIHDAGIVEGKNFKYVIVILSTGAADETETKHFLAEISETIFHSYN